MTFFSMGIQHNSETHKEARHRARKVQEECQLLQVCHHRKVVAAGEETIEVNHVYEVCLSEISMLTPTRVSRWAKR